MNDSTNRVNSMHTNHPDQTLTDPFTPTPPRQKSRRPLVIGIISVVFLVILTASILIYSLLHRPAAAPSETPVETPQLEPLSAALAIDHVKLHFKATEQAREPLLIPFMVSDKDFYTVIPSSSVPLSVAGEIAPDNVDRQRESILNSFKKDNFSLKVAYDSDTEYLADFLRPDVVCQLHIAKPTEEMVNYFFETKCLDEAQFKEYADEQEQLARVYTPLTSTATQFGFVGKPMIVASPTEGYATVELPVSIVIDHRMSALNDYAMFYRTPDGLWHYFRNHVKDVVVECEQYRGVDVTTAYSGQPCRSLAKDTLSTVQPTKK